MTGRSVLQTLLVLLLAALLVVPPATAAAPGKAKRKRRVHHALQKVEDVPGLPRVLLIGDSISIGYTVPTRELLKGKANVQHPRDNCGPTTRGLEKLDAWLGEKKWDVIHFNFGLHDLKYINDKGALVPVAEGHQQVPIDEYRKNLDEIVTRLKKTGAALIWASTTPVPEGAAGRIKGDAARYNAVAAEVMSRRRRGHEEARCGHERPLRVRAGAAREDSASEERPLYARRFQGAGRAGGGPYPEGAQDALTPCGT